MTQQAQPWRNERGATLVLMAVLSAVLVAILALAIDLGMLYDTRGEAQRAADAAALAGASAFIDVLPPSNPFVAAHDRAMEYAGRNTMRSTPIDTTTEVTVAVWQDTVQVTVARASVATWFARIFGIRSVPIGARATAEAAEAGTATCLAPLAVPDIWFETSTGAGGQDANSDRVWDPTETWAFEPGNGDLYARYSPTNPSATGYGSSFRNATGILNDLGRPIIMKAQDPSQSLTSGFFYPWRIGTSTGAQDYKDNFGTCNPTTIQLNVPYDIENGNMVGPTRQAVNGLIALDPGATWDPTTGQVINSAYGAGTASPRVLTIGLFDPAQIAGIQGGGGLQLSFNNFALFFLEGIGTGSGAPVIGRFMYFASGSPGGSGSVTATLAKVPRLIR